MRQPVNLLAPWGVNTEKGGYVGIDEDGLTATKVTVTQVKFGDGSTMSSAGSGLPSFIDEGTF